MILGMQIGIFGLARTGLSALKYLIKHCPALEIYLFDDKDKEDYNLCSDPSKIILRDFKYIITSPGIDLKQSTNKVIEFAKDNNIKMICDIELFYLIVQEAICYTTQRSIFIGITGTNGKSTTAALVHHALNHCGENAVIGGNFGIPIFDLVIDEDVYVLEVSSYQIDLMYNIKFDIALITNIAPDHLDRYDNDFEQYHSSKERILRMTRSVPKRSEETFANPYLPGIHNQENMQDAFSICAQYFALKSESKNLCIKHGIESFKGLKHRMQYLGTHQNNANIYFINDSKATSADATRTALNCHDNIFLILGGVAKTDGIESIAALIKQKVIKCYLIGQASQKFAQVLIANSISYAISSTLERALNDIFLDLGDSGCVMLSPACASFDQFKDFEHRGDEFIKICNKYI